MLSIFKGFGLSETDIAVYTFLEKEGPRIGRELPGPLRKNRRQIYRSLKELQTKNLVTLSAERSTRFQAVPFETVIDLFVKSTIKEAKRLKKEQLDLYST